MTTDEMRRLATEAQEIAGKATEGPWAVAENINEDGDGIVPVESLEKWSDDELYQIGADCVIAQGRNEDWDFIADARTRVPALAAALMAAADEIDALLGGIADAERNYRDVVLEAAKERGNGNQLRALLHESAAATDRLRAACAAGPWQPIETAPRDYKAFLGMYQSNYAICWFNPDSARFETDDEGFDSSTQPFAWAEIRPKGEGR